MRWLLYLLFIGLSQSLLAEERPALLSEIKARSPWGRFEDGDFSPGIKSFRFDSRCDIHDLEQILKLQNPPLKFRIPDRNEVLRGSAGQRNIQVEQFEKSFLQEASKLLKVLQDSKEKLVENREICI